jgi:SAM-dependent methyltransferase
MRSILAAERRAALRLYARAVELNQRNILGLLTPDSTASLLDLGCDDGLWTAELAARLRARRVYGVEIVPAKSTQASHREILVVQADLSDSLPFRDAYFDVVHSNQVIEHVPDIDVFVQEAFRVLRPGGYAVFSTENASSWHNIGAAIMGWQIFSATNVSKRVAGLGNPLALHRNSGGIEPSWTHKTVMNYRGLLELLVVHGFTRPRVLGAGYHPLPASIARLDARHAHFLAVRVDRPIIT